MERREREGGGCLLSRYTPSHYMLDKGLALSKLYFR